LFLVQKKAQTLLRTISKQVAHQMTSGLLENRAKRGCLGKFQRQGAWFSSMSDQGHPESGQTLPHRKAEEKPSEYSLNF
jgi:hypothetical protein